MLRVTVVGVGLIGRQRAAAVAQIPGAALAATVDPQHESPPFPGVAHYRVLEEVPGSDYDAAIIAVPHDIAGPLTAGVLAAGKPVLLEKPLGTSATDARELERLAGAVAIPSFVGFNYRYLPAIRAVMDAVAEGQLGELRSIDMLIGHGGHPGSAEGWKLDQVRAGGGVLLDPGVHLLDLLLRIAPGAVCTAVEATRGFWGTGIEEEVAMTFRVGNAIASLRVSHVRWINTFRIEVFGEDGYAIAEGRGGNYGPMTLRIGERWGWTKREGVTQRATEEVADFGSTDSSLLDELRDVVAAWRSGDVPAGRLHPATMAEARAVTELCALLYDRID